MRRIGNPPDRRFTFADFRTSRICGAALMLALASTPASSQETESVYTRFDSKTCKREKGRGIEDYGSWTCPGYQDLRVLLSAGDQRMHVTYGNRKKEDIALSQTFPGFNSVYQGTVEWRLEKKPDGATRPFATILRWNVMLSADQERATGPVASTGRVLVITRLGPGGVCHVGYVDARANPDANDLARKLADEHARAFRCGGQKPIVVGKVTESGMMPGD
jgi:hypothetical protein